MDVNEHSYESSHRFSNPYDLWTRYSETKRKSDEKRQADKKLVDMYKRVPHRIKRGGKPISEPNWGGFKSAINDQVKTLTSVALDRKVWCRINTYVGLEDNTDERNSDLITEAFHKFCITPWHKKEMETIRCCLDAVMFKKGVMYWDSPYEVYPCYIPQENVLPDTNATVDEDSFDILFIRDEVTAVTLYNEVKNKEKAERLGWNRRAILKALKSGINSLKDYTTKDILDRWRKGGVSQLDQDTLIPIVYCFVKEYEEASEENADKQKKGNRISLTIIPENNHLFGVDNTKSGKPSLKRDDCLRFVDYIYKDFTNVVSVRTSAITQPFYDNDSTGNELYLGFKFYDLSLNSVIRSIKRSMRLWIKTDNQDTRKKIQNSNPDDEVYFAGLDDTISANTFGVDISQMMEMMRTVMINMQNQTSMSSKSPMSSPKGYAISKGEAQILNERLDDSTKTDIKLFISKDRVLVEEIYRRFISVTDNHDKEYKNYKRFRDWLEAKGVPKEAWDYDNVEIYSRFNQFSGSASQNLASAQALVQATQLKPSSNGEQRAKRDLISSIVGESNIEDYLDSRPMIENEIMIIGQENESLDNPNANPINIPVTDSDNHIIHVEGHLSDMIYKLDFASKLLQQSAQDNSYMKMFFIERAADIINAQDNKGAHIEAHVFVLQQDETKAAQLQQLVGQLNQARQTQDLLANQVAQMRQALVEQGQQSSLQDQEFNHRQRMDELEFQKATAMNNLAVEKAAQASASKQDNSIRNQAIKETGKERDREQKQQVAQISVTEKAAKSDIEIQKERMKLEIERQKAVQKQNQTNNNNPT